MGDMTVRQIDFSGGRSRTVPLAWGQRTAWEDIGHYLPELKAFFVLTRRVPVPAGLGLAAITDALRVLLERHESLRSRYRALPAATGTTPGTAPDIMPGAAPASGPGTAERQVVQQVLPAGLVPLTLVEWGPTDPLPFAAAVERAEQAMVGARIEHASEPPVRFRVVTRAGEAALVLLGVSHLAADARAVDLLMAELAGLLAAAAAGAPTPPPWTSWQPADQVAFEQSPAGMLRNAASLRRLRGQLASATAAFPEPLPPPRHPGHPRYLCGRLESRAVPLALRVLARRHRTGGSAVLLAATAALTRALTGAERCTFALVAAGRTDPRAAQFAVSSLSQTTWATLDTAVDSFAELTAAAATALAEADRHCPYDPLAARALVRDLERRRGTALDLGCRFNDMWAWTRKQPVRELPDHAAVQAATSAGRLCWPADQATDNDRITLSVNVYGTADRIILDALADTFRLPRPRLAALLLGYERLLVELVARDVPPAETARLLEGDRRCSPGFPGQTGVNSGNVSRLLCGPESE
ncbi:hypothetical protein OG455_40195 [Kitasatospora sp. NBC_01287]|uniref:hypothetical protein n=1 Tax=Kitasatospora sp. NBC_01287 TaxID=2903573 RepID=UPI00225BA6F7|nr:hypothetical protein [Kitasatospora sp. NBC_01287]MCX4751658.1 hypothetical protein [Kitasatospora sp. NBC_01287]